MSCVDDMEGFEIDLELPEQFKLSRSSVRDEYQGLFPLQKLPQTLFQSLERD